jgi:TonB-dependent starch-binding outer membrane protein SusC
MINYLMKSKTLTTWSQRMGLLFLCLLCVNLTSYAQIVVKGVVTDAATGETLPGVGVVVEGSTVGTTSDMNGKYAFTVPSDKSVLVFSFIGYTPQKLPVDGKADVSIALAPDVKSLNDVVVIGYGTANRRDLTSSISSISGKTIAESPVTSVAEAMTGRLAGVQITTVDGSPDADIIIRVRGGGSITQDNSPLYIVDGFVVDKINDISPNDIASIDVLKDASSSAIYGARGANGVILITTKTAKGGKTTVSYNGSVQMRTLPKEMSVMSPYEFVLAQYEYAKLRNDTASFTKYFGVYDDLELYKAQSGTDWQKELYGKPTYSQSHNFSISGGEKTKYLLSLNNIKEDGLMVGSGYTRTNALFKLNHEVSQSLKVDLSGRYSKAITRGRGTAGTSNVKTTSAITRMPINGLADYFELDPLASDDDYQTFIESVTSPVTLAKQDYKKVTAQNYSVGGGVTWSILKNLSYRSELDLNYTVGDTKQYYGPLTTESANVGKNLPLGDVTNTWTHGYRWANTLSFNFVRGNVHNFNILVGEELSSKGGSSDYTRVKYFPASMDPDKLFANMGYGTLDSHTSTVNTDNNLSSYFGRVGYTLLGRYLFNATVRADGSSYFKPGNRWGYFPSASAAWRISDESFMKSQEIVSNLKLRASYGSVGNNNITADSWRRQFTVSTTRTIGFDDATNSYYTTSTTLVNPDLKWETTVNRGVGLEFGLFHDRLNGTLEGYWNCTKDLLVTMPIPAYTGYTSELRNIGQTSNKGVELSLNGYIIQNKQFTLSMSFNVGMNRPKIDNLGGQSSMSITSNWASTDLKSADDYRLQVGKTIGLIYGYVSDGFYSVDDFNSYNASTKTYNLKPGVADDSGILGGAVGFRPGMMKLKNLAGDQTVTANDDRTVIGSAVPKHSGGFSFNTTFKGFDLGLFFNWVYGNQIYNANKIASSMYYRTTWGNLLNTMNSDHRYKYIDNNGTLITSLEGLRELNKNATIWSPFSSGTASPVVTSWAIEDGSFLRLNNVTLGYTLPKGLISKVGMRTFRVYCTVYNVWVWTNYTGYDPEVSTTRSNSYQQLTPGLDYSGMPKSRTYTAGVNITF